MPLRECVIVRIGGIRKRIDMVYDLMEGRKSGRFEGGEAEIW
jgi:hypothetical protein